MVGAILISVWLKNQSNFLTERGGRPLSRLAFSFLKIHVSFNDFHER